MLVTAGDTNSRWLFSIAWNARSRKKPGTKSNQILSVPCANFIAAIIQCAIPAEGQARVREQTPAVEDEIRNLAKRFVNAKSDEIDERLGVAIGVLAEFRSLRERVPLREKTAPRNRFMASLRTWFQEVCGKPHDNVVAMLTNVVFDLQEPPEKGDPPLSPERKKVSGEAVRSAARNARDRERRTRRIPRPGNSCSKYSVELPAATE